MKKRIYFVGAHSTGKTTLAREVSKIYSLPLVPEQARVILSEWNTSLSSVRLSAEMSNRFQTEIWRRQRDVEEELKLFVSDRGCDHLAYAAQFSDVAFDIFNDRDFSAYMVGMENSHVFLVRPQRELIVEDGVRADCTWDAVVRIDAAIEFLLNICGVNYVPIDSVRMAERLRIVRAVVSQK